MRPHLPRSDSALAALAALTAAALLTGCGGNKSSPGSSPTPPRARLSQSPSPTWGSDPGAVQSVAAVGDSITRGFDACSVLSDCPRVSWVTGTDARVDSFAHRLLPKTERSRPARGTTVKRSWNLARSGARMRDLPRQMERAVRKRPDLVAVLIGSNDACRKSAPAMTSVKRFRASFEESLALLHTKLPNAKVLVGSIPDLKRVWRLGRRQPMAKQVWGLGICPSMLVRPNSMATADQERRAAVAKRVDAYNRVLEETCAQYVTCRFDGGAVHEYEFTTKELSPWDWFHPSVHGHAKLARILYKVAFGHEGTEPSPRPAKDNGDR